MPALAKVIVVLLEGSPVFLRFYEEQASGRAARFSAEVAFGREDHVVFDGSSLAEVEDLARACLPATWDSRRVLAAHPITP